MKITVCANDKSGAEQNRPLRVMMEIPPFRRVSHPPKSQTQYLAPESRNCANPQQGCNKPATKPQHVACLLQVRVNSVAALLQAEKRY